MMELDVDVMRRLYAFGGLICYEVKYFDPMLFQVRTAISTFSKEAANRELATKKAQGFTAGMDQKMIKFHGAFSQEPVDGKVKA